jgi:hypothetical protein
MCPAGFELRDGRTGEVDLILHARGQHHRHFQSLRDLRELERVFSDDVDVERVRPGHRADLMVDQHHRGIVGREGILVHFATPESTFRDG